MSKLQRRILVGSALTAGVAVVLFANDAAPPGVVPWAVATLLTFGVVLELALMDGFRGRGFTFTLGVPAVCTSFLYLPFAREVAAPYAGTDPRILLLSYVGAVLIAAAAFSGERFVRQRLGLRPGWVWALVPGGLWVAALVVWGAEGVGEQRLIWLVLGVLALAPLVVLREGRVLGDLRTTLAFAAWAVPPLFGWILLDARWGTRGLVALVFLSKIGDVFGYFVGRAIGVTKPLPTISPNKTVAGFVASFVAGTAAGAIALPLGLLPGASPSVLTGALVGFLLNLAAQVGDLLESVVKRRAGVKDSSAVFGPSGGFLDVVDSLLLTVPVAVLTWPWLLGD